jgi:ATP-dependent Lon protease
MRHSPPSRVSVPPEPIAPHSGKAMSDNTAQRLFDTPPDHGPTRAREALIAEAIGDCGQLLNEARSALLQAQEIAQSMQDATARMTEEREQLRKSLELYGRAVLTLEKGVRERFSATLTEQTRMALEHASAELRRASDQEQREMGHAAVAAVQAAMRAQATWQAPKPRSSLVQRYLDWVSSPWGHRATLFMSVLAAIVFYNSGIFSRS